MAGMKVETAPQPPIIVTLERDEAITLCRWLAGAVTPHTALPVVPAQLLGSLENVLNGYEDRA